jgi:hypothetical protein
MHGCRVDMKDGRVVLGTLWALNRAWELEVIEDSSGETQVIPLAEVKSAVQYGARVTAATVGEDEDLLVTARKRGWTG